MWSSNGSLILITKEANKGGASVVLGIDKYLKDNCQLNNDEFYHELPIDPFEVHHNIIKTRWMISSEKI